MCGGIIANLNKIPKSELSRYYSDAEVEKMEKQGQFQSYFWDQKPVLAVEEKGKVELVDWGNRDKQIPLPKTGWAKEESIKEGEWDYLKPKQVKIVADKGYEKGTLFNFKDGTKGILIEDNCHKRAYMITQPADSEYNKSTGHDRMPPGSKSEYKKET